MIDDVGGALLLIVGSQDKTRQVIIADQPCQVFIDVGAVDADVLLL